LTYKDKCCLVFDTGGGTFHVERLAKDFGQVYFFTPWADGNPKFENYCEGLGLKNVTKVLDPFNYIDKADLICFLDVGEGDKAAYFREKGKVVFGAGRGEKLEQDRFFMRKLQKELGLPTQHTVQVNGVKGLREYLKRNPDKYVKLNIWRGNVESFYAKDYQSVEMILDEIETGFGPHKDEYKFLVEAPIPDAVEVGFDGFFNGKDFIRPLMWGVEAGRPYIGKVANELPWVLEDFIARITPELRKLDYRGAISNELRVVNAKKAYLVDLTCRFPYPLSCVYTENIENYSEVIYKVAAGEDVTIKPRGKYVGCLPLTSPHAKDNWLQLFFDEKKSGRIKLNTPTKVGDNYYAVKGSDPVFNLVAIGNGVKDIITQLKDLTQEVEAFELDKSPVSVLYNIKDELRKLRAMGVDF
jgi:hypothetical protein